MLVGWRLMWAFGLLWVVATSVAEPPQVFDINLEAQSVSDALYSLSEQTGAPVVFSYDLVRNRKANPVKGRYTLPQALDALLRGTGLSGGLSDKGVVTVSAVKPPPTPQPGEPSVTSDDNNRNKNRSTIAHKAGIFSLLASIGAAFSSAAAEDASDAVPNNVSEVIVSAQKRGDERLQDTPIPMSVLDPQALTDTDRLLLRDYATSVPGLSVSPNIENNQMLSIRGVTTGGFSVPTVAVLIDDVPFAAGNEVPDIDPGDLARIEVLRGPQGTLYGANAMGGLINYITILPSTEGFSGRVEAGTSDVHNGAEPGFSMRAAANLPISDTFAIRASAFTRQDPGYIDNPSLGLRGVNEVQAYGFRTAALWRPSQDVSLLVSALDQNIRSNGIPEVNKGPGLGDWDQDYVAGVGGFQRRTEAYSATFKAKLGSVDFTSVSGYSINRAKEPFDFTPDFSGVTESLYGVTGTALFDYGDYTKYTQELRVSGSTLDKLDWLLGGFYTHEKHQESDIVEATNPTTGQFIAQGWYYNFPSKIEESAAFVDLTYHFTSQFDVQVGGRESHTIVGNYTEYAVGPILGNPTPNITPAVSSSANTFTYLLTPRFKISPDLMVYARIASGFRPGGPNNLHGETGLPAQFNPDKTQNYEIGAKGDFLDHTLSVDASIYYIDWKNIQIQLFSAAPSSYESNGSRAKSEGVELSLVSKPLTGLTISAWVAYNDAVLTQPFPSNSTASGLAGDRLPNSARFSGNLSLEQSFPLWSGAAGFFGATGSFTGDEVGVFQTTELRQTFPSYTKTDLHAGVRGESWTASVYVNNVTDARALLNGGIGYIQPNAYIYITPRTVGLSVTKKF